MKGTIFVELISMVEAAHGLDMVDAVIDKAGDALSTDGAYTAVGTYDHEELLALVTALSELAPEQAPTLLDDFAVCLMGAFQRMHPEFFNASGDLLDFLESVETHIHQEVLKLYPDSRTPALNAQRLGEGAVRLSYRSHRPLAPFAVSLARAGAGVFEQPVDIEIESQSDDGRAADFVVRVVA